LQQWKALNVSRSESSAQVEKNKGYASLMVSCSFGFTGAYQFQGGAVHLNHCFHSTFMLGFTQPGPSRQGANNYAYAACDFQGSLEKAGDLPFLSFLRQL
jgi:hypothetical protein